MTMMKNEGRRKRGLFSPAVRFLEMIHTNLDFQQILHVQVFQLESTFDLKRYLSRLVEQKNP